MDTDRSLSPSSALLGAPEEILVKILELLPPRDQLVASRTCRAFRACANTPRISYDRALQLAGCVDVPNIPKTSDSTATPSTEAEATEGEANDNLRSPHTGKPRQVIPSVSFSPWPKEPASTRQDVSNLSITEKAELLAKREQAWETLTPRQVREVHTTGAPGVYELQEGIYLLCIVQSFEFWGARPKQIRLVPLPSATDPDLEDPILPCKEVTMDFEVADLTMDPSQDLIVVAEHRPAPLSRGASPPVFKYHLLTMSTFEPHPLAEMPVLDFPPAASQMNVAQQLIQVMGDTMVALVAVIDLEGGDHALAHEEMVAWNWKTGNVLGRVDIGRTLARCTIAMLTPTTVAVANPGTTSYEPGILQLLGTAAILGRHPDRVASPPSIDIYSFAQSKPVQVQQPLPLSSDDDETPRGYKLASLMLPGIVGRMVHQFHMRPDPAFPPSHGGLGRKPFTLDPRSGVLVIELQLDEFIPLQPINIGESEKYELFVLRETLVDIAEEREAALLDLWATDPEDSIGCLNVPWRQWGEEKSRMMKPTMRRRQWVCSCSGYRYASIEQRRGPRPEGVETHVVVHDFNPFSVAREQAVMEREAGEYNMQEELDEEALDAEDVEDAEAELRAMDEAYGFLTGDDRPWFIEPRSSETSSSRAGGPPDRQMRKVHAPLHAEVEQACDDECVIELVTKPTLLSVNNTSFNCNVTTSLPYRKVTRRALSNPEGVMIEDQRLLLISPPDRDNDFRHQSSTVTTWCF